MCSPSGHLVPSWFAPDDNHEGAPPGDSKGEACSGLGVGKCVKIMKKRYVNGRIEHEPEAGVRAN